MLNRRRICKIAAVIVAALARSVDRLSCVLEDLACRLERLEHLLTRPASGRIKYSGAGYQDVFPALKNAYPPTAFTDPVNFEAPFRPIARE